MSGKNIDEEDYEMIDDNDDDDDEDYHVERTEDETHEDDLDLSKDEDEIIGREMEDGYIAEIESEGYSEHGREMEDGYIAEIESEGYSDHEEYQQYVVTDDDGFEEDDVSREVNENVHVIHRKKRGRPKGSYRKRKEISDSEMSTVNVKRRKKLPMIEVSALVGVLCCASLCLPSLPPDAIYTLRDHLSSMTKAELSQWMLDWLWTHPRGNNDFCYLVGEWTVCLTAFLTTIGMPVSTFYTIRKRYLKGEKVIGRQGLGSGRQSLSEIASLWIHDYANKYAEKQPDQLKFHLPPCLTKASVYDMYIEEMADSGENFVSLSHFYWIWRKCVSYVVIPAVSRFSKCNICSQIKTKLAETKDRTIRFKLQKERERHLLKQSMERRKYYKHALKARQNPKRYMSIIIDAMDQSKTEIPHFLFLSTVMKGMWKLRTHLIGAIVHGIGIFGFFDYFQYPHSSNLTIHVLLNIMYERKDLLPDVLYLQMDNCARENKNKYIFAFLCLLIEKKIFKKIKVSFLMVGHTHEDIDQVFSRFSVWLSKHSVPTLPKLMKAFEQCYQPTPKSIETDNVFDVTGWLQDCMNPVSGHSQPHAFKFVLDSDTQKAKIVYKKWANDKKWLSSTGMDHFLLKKHPSVSRPDLMQKNDEKIDVEKLQADVNKIDKQYKCNQSGWWTRFFHYLLHGMNNADQEPIWLLEEIVSAKEDSQRQIMTAAGNEADVDLQIEGLSDEETIPTVVIGKKGNAKQNGIAVNDLVLTNVARHAGEWPQLGKVISINNDHFTIHWFKGSKTGPWTPCSRAVGRGRRESWTEEIKESDVWCHGFTLTNTNKLPSKIKEQIDNYADF